MSCLTKTCCDKKLDTTHLRKEAASLAGSVVDQAEKAALWAAPHVSKAAGGVARAAKDWSRADALRDKLPGAGVVVEDSPTGAASARGNGIHVVQIGATKHFPADPGLVVVPDLASITLMSDGASVYECTSADEVVDLVAGGQGVFGIAVGRVWHEVEGALADLPVDHAQALGTPLVGDGRAQRPRAPRRGALRFERRVSIYDEAGYGDPDMSEDILAPPPSSPVAGTLMVEPTESEPLAELDRFIAAMRSIRAEIDEVASGAVALEDSVLRRSPHTLAAVTAEPWKRPYSRATAAFPLAGMETDKYFPPVSRVDNAWGDRHLMCTCPPPDAFEAHEA